MLKLVSFACECCILDLTLSTLTSVAYGLKRAIWIEESRIASPSEVPRKLDAEYPMEHFGKFLPVVYLVLNCRTRKLRFNSPGHPRSLLVHADGSTERLSHGEFLHRILKRDAPK